MHASAVNCSRPCPRRMFHGRPWIKLNRDAVHGSPATHDLKLVTDDTGKMHRVAWANPPIGSRKGGPVDAAIEPSPGVSVSCACAVICAFGSLGYVNVFRVSKADCGKKEAEEKFNHLFWGLVVLLGRFLDDPFVTENFECPRAYFAVDNPCQLGNANLRRFVLDCHLGEPNVDNMLNLGPMWEERNERFAAPYRA